MKSSVTPNSFTASLNCALLPSWVVTSKATKRCRVPKITASVLTRIQQQSVVHKPCEYGINAICHWRKVTKHGRYEERSVLYSIRSLAYWWYYAHKRRCQSVTRTLVHGALYNSNYIGLHDWSNDGAPENTGRRSSGCGPGPLQSNCNVLRSLIDTRRQSSQHSATYTKITFSMSIHSVMWSTASKADEMSSTSKTVHIFFVTR